MVLLSVIRHVKWADGTGCTASIPTLAREAHQTKKTTIGHIKTLIDAGLISRKRRFSKATETLLATTQLASELPYPVSVETTLTSQRSRNASNQSSSSTNPGNQSNTPKMSKVKKEPETEKKKPRKKKKRRPRRRDPPRPKKEVDEKQRGTVKTFQALEEEGALRRCFIGQWTWTSPKVLSPPLLRLAKLRNFRHMQRIHPQLWHRFHPSSGAGGYGQSYGTGHFPDAEYEPISGAVLNDEGRVLRLAMWSRMYGTHKIGPGNF